jgi:hypothetical protein
MHHEEARRILVVAKISDNYTYRISANPLHAKASPNFREPD